MVWDSPSQPEVGFISLLLVAVFGAIQVYSRFTGRRDQQADSTTSFSVAPQSRGEVVESDQSEA